MKLFYGIVVALVATVLALFAASNRANVTLALWPLPFVLELPLYLATLAGLLIGFIVGVLAAWIAGRQRRREARRRANRIAALERELAATQAQLPSAGEGAPARLAGRG
ncbi:MAG: lipopolysaccharide assembly protein LapA domain-containing protein [Stellaceae bacterium]